jgi:O-antigen/teichoic acid export membrane protein
VTADVPKAEGRSSIASGATYTLMAQASTLGLGFLTSIMTSRALGAGGKGEVAILLATPAMAAVLLGLGLNIANSYHVGTKRNTVAEAISDSLAAALAMAVLGVGGVFLFLRLFVPALDSTSSGVLLAASFIFVPTLLNQNLGGILIGSGRVRALAGQQITSAVVGFSVLLALFLTELLTVANAVVLNLSIGILGTVILVSVLSPEVRRTGVARPSFRRLREQSGYALNAYIANLAGYLDKRQDIVLLGMLSTSAAAGVYSVGVVFAELLWQIPRALSPALRARSLEAGEEEGEAATATAIRVAMVMSFLIFALLAVVLRPLIEFVYGADFVGAYTVFLILSPGVLVYGVAMVAWNHLLTRGILMPRVAMMITVLNLIGNVLLIPSFGSTGAALAATLSYTLGGSIITWRFVRLSGMSAGQVFAPRTSDVRLVRDSVGRLARRSGKGDA